MKRYPQWAYKAYKTSEKFINPLHPTNNKPSVKSDSKTNYIDLNAKFDNNYKKIKAANWGRKV